MCSVPVLGVKHSHARKRYPLHVGRGYWAMEQRCTRTVSCSSCGRLPPCTNRNRVSIGWVLTCHNSISFYFWF